ncbi:hypothetical protein PVL29_006526 [Vitis rotundifolia]|uniref:Glycosyltransferase n=1 Tax=Vitis rotundifolia TaxID=103349 RepID=A0AA39A7E3_VITRO|nr:hypothetical protein PVL29_006526 [Vitis rotundifolia]
MGSPHFLLVTFPAQGHINPALQFAKRMIRTGAQVSFATSVSAHRRMAKRPNPEGLQFVPFSDGYDDGFKSSDDIQQYIEIVLRNSDEGRPFTCIVHTLLVPWAAEVARGLLVPYALLWIEPATVLDIYYYYLNGYGDVFRNISNEPSCSIELPALPLLSSRDLPSFLVNSNDYTFFLPMLQERLEALNQETNPKVLVNYFDALETEALKAVDKLHLIGIGPLVPSAYLDAKDPSDTSFGGDLFQGSDDYMEWLNSKPKSSVVYVSFGSISVLLKTQKEEIARGLLDCGHPFLWVIRAPEKGEEVKEEDKLSCREELEKKGMIVPWCSQIEVLTHPSLGCFVSHCGWNSTLESLVSGVPLVAFPQWADQGTNAKLIEDIWKIGIRVTVNEEGIVESDEIKRCLEIAMRGGKWKNLAREAVKDSGSSDMNLKGFVDEVGQGCNESIGS